MLTLSVFHPNFLIHYDVDKNIPTERSSGAHQPQIYTIISVLWLLELHMSWNLIGGHPQMNRLGQRRGKKKGAFEVGLALSVQIRPMTHASLFLLEAPLPFPDPPVDCDAMLWFHFLLEDMPSMKREVKMFYRYYSWLLWLHLSFTLRTKKSVSLEILHIFFFLDLSKKLNSQ